MSLAVRSQSFLYVNNANSGTLALPAGAAAGDSVVLFAGHGYQVNAPSGWDVEYNTNQGNYNAGVFHKILTSADITAGSVTVTFTGGYYGHIAMVCMVGAISSFRTRINTTSSTGAASRTLTTDTSPQIGEYALYIAGGRANVVIGDASGGTALQADNQANSSFVMSGLSLTAAGAVTDTWSYTTVPSGDFEAILVLSTTATPPGQVMEIAAEVMRDSSPAAQVMELAAEVMRDSSPPAQVMQISVEVLRAVTSVFRRRHQFIQNTCYQ